MADRYFSEVPISGDFVTLAGQEAHHLRDVMRATRGDRVLLFDGSGAEFLAEVVEAKRSEVQLRVVERIASNREVPWPLTLGVALPKGERQRWLLEKGVEVGVTRLVPLLTERGVADPTPSALERLRRGVIEATKQCGRNRLLEIGEPQKLADYVRQAASEAVRLLAHPDGTPLASLTQTGTPSISPPVGDRGSEIPRTDSAPTRVSAAGVMLAIGPEGGFTTNEVSLAAEAGWQTVSLGPRVLRVETAAILLAGLAAQGYIG